MIMPGSEQKKTQVA